MNKNVPAYQLSRCFFSFDLFCFFLLSPPPLPPRTIAAASCVFSRVMYTRMSDARGAGRIGKAETLSSAMKHYRPREIAEQKHFMYPIKYDPAAFN